MKWEGLYEWISSLGDILNEKDDIVRWWSEGLWFVVDGEVVVLVLVGG